MSTARFANASPYGYSLVLHAGLLAVLASGLVLPRHESPPVALTIQAAVVDQALIQALAQRRREDDRARRAAEEQQQQRQAERERQQQAEQEAQATRQRENERVNEQKRQAEASATKARQQAEQQQSRAAAERKRSEQQAKARSEAEAKRATEDAKARTARESDLRARLAAEERRTSAEAGGLKAEYIARIQAHVELRWFKPPGVRAGLRCLVNVTQIPGGEVVEVKMGSCNATEAVRQSIITAIRNASPLPSPPDPTLFDRQVELSFTSED